MSLVSFIKKPFTREAPNSIFMHPAFDHMLEGIQIHDFNWRYLYVNNALVNYSHYSKEELLGNTLMDKYPGIEQTSLFKVLERCMKKRTNEHFETEFIFPDGSKADFELSIQPVPEGLFILSINITERKRAQEKQKTSEIYYHSVIEQANDTIYIIDSSPKPKFLDINQSGCKLLGYTKEELLRLTVFDINFKNDLADSSSTIEELRAGKPIRKERKLKRKDGSFVETELSAKKMEDGNIMVVARDISERKKSEEFVTNFRDITQQKETEEKLKTSEQYYRSIIEQAKDMIYITDTALNSKFLDINASGCQMLGYTKEEFLKLKPSDLVFEEDLITNPIKLSEFRSGIFITSERRLKRKDGTALETESTIKMSIDGNLIVFAHDITERKKTEREIKILNENLEKKVVERTIELEYIIAESKESDEKFQKVFHTNAVGIGIILTSNMHYTDANEAFVQMTGFSKEELIGHSSQELGMIVNKEREEEILNEIKKQGSAKNFEMTLRHKSGREFTILSSVETIILKGHMHSLSIIYDITDRKKAEEELALVNKELEAFTYSVSHDLRAPLRAINGYAEILQEDFGPQFNEEGNRLLENITQKAVKMGNLIDDLLAFSKLGRAEIQKEQVDLKELVEAVIKSQDKNPVHPVKIKYKDLHKVKADYNLLYQVLFNLISNGIKYSSKNKNPEVEIRSAEQNGEIVISVRDNGVGFDMQYVNKLFGVFQRLHSQEEFEGTGVGLAIVQRIIAKHNGKVWAEGKLNEGATFHVSLPIG